MGEEQLTLARFLRHSVQALGVTTPRPRRLLEPAALVEAEGALGVPALALLLLDEGVPAAVAGCCGRDGSAEELVAFAVAVAVAFAGALSAASIVPGGGPVSEGDAILKEGDCGRPGAGESSSIESGAIGKGRQPLPWATVLA